MTPRENGRKSSYTSLWLLLVAAFVIIFTLSCFDSTPSILGYSPKPSEMANSILRGNTHDEATSLCDDTDTDSVSGSPATVPVDTATQTLLFIGDSMLDGLSPRLAAYANASGHKLYSVTWYSSSSKAWAESGKLKEYIGRIKPTFVFICLGANELNIKDIRSKRKEFVAKIISDIDTIPYLWIGPPNWKKDTGINDLIAESAARGGYFKSDGMEFERRKDGAHPTAASAILWMDSVVRWMPEHSFHPIRFDTPDKRTGRPTKIFTHSPEEI